MKRILAKVVLGALIATTVAPVAKASILKYVPAVMIACGLGACVADCFTRETDPSIRDYQNKCKKQQEQKQKLGMLKQVRWCLVDEKITEAGSKVLAEINGKIDATEKELENSPIKPALLSTIHVGQAVGVIGALAAYFQLLHYVIDSKTW